MSRDTLHTMEIKSCTKNNGVHQWRYEKRKHNNPHRRYVICQNCNRTAQESENGIKFTTARNVIATKTVTGSYRTDKPREEEIKAAGYGSINRYVNESPVIQLPVNT